MNRTLKFAGIAALGAMAATGVALLVARGLRTYRTWSDYRLDGFGPAPTATATPESPTPDEYQLVLLVREYGWPCDSLLTVYGTNENGPFLVFPFNRGDAFVQFANGSHDAFVIARWDGPQVTSPLFSQPNPRYEDVVKELTRLP